MDAATHDQILALTEDLPAPADKDLAAKRREALESPTVTAGGPSSELMLHIFGGSNRGGQWCAAREIRMVNVFGGGELDFSEATFSATTTRIKMFCLFGGATVLVPEGVNTVSRALCIFGGVDNRGPTTTLPNAPTIQIEGFMLFGGVSIRVKRTFKERMLEFADTVKSMFKPVL
jgi:predicted membrane protein